MVHRFSYELQEGFREVQRRFKAFEIMCKKISKAFPEGFQGVSEVF